MIGAPGAKSTTCWYGLGEPPPWSTIGLSTEIKQAFHMIYASLRLRRKATSLSSPTVKFEARRSWNPWRLKICISSYGTVFRVWNRIETPLRKANLQNSRTWSLKLLKGMPSASGLGHCSKRSRRWDFNLCHNTETWGPKQRGLYKSTGRHWKGSGIWWLIKCR